MRFPSDVLYYGGDYNPEQWTRETWKEDMRLMNEAKVNLVTLGVFSWANIEIEDGVYSFDWLDEVLDLLHGANISSDLATATASPPAWLSTRYPEILPVDDSGIRISHGGRQAYCVSSPIYKAKAVALAGKLAERYSNHPAVVMWHVNNEYGCHNNLCFCDESAKSWRTWLRGKYETLDSLNYAWGTDFWSQRYYQWEEIQPPRKTPSGTFPNPTMYLDYRRFSNDEILGLFIAERNEIKKFDSKNPVTTNFMSMKHSSALDYWKWSGEVDFVSTDHYLNAEDTNNHIDLAFQADLTRGFAGGKPWLLMEHSTSAVNWQPINKAKLGNEMLRNSISHLARGSNGTMFFQWRQSLIGSEKFHSAMVPHAGTDSKIWRNVVRLGADLKKLSALSNSITEPAKIAIIFDYESWWALSHRNLPSNLIDYTSLVHDWYRALWNIGARVDFVSPSSSLEEIEKYSLVLVPTLYLISQEQQNILTEFAIAGGALAVSYFSGISDKNDRINTGGYGGKLVNEICGVRVVEFAPQSSGLEIQLSNGFQASEWIEYSNLVSATSLADFTGKFFSGSTAISKSKNYKAWYLGTRLSDESCQSFFKEMLSDLAIGTQGGAGVEIVKRGPYYFRIDHNEDTVEW